MNIKIEADDVEKTVFPGVIGLEQVSNYSQEFRMSKFDNDLVFDLRDTYEIHSSFVGLLIYLKNTMNKNGKDFMMLLSPAIENIFKMFGLLNYFSPCITKAA